MKSKSGMKYAFILLSCIAFLIVFVLPGFCQTNTQQESSTATQSSVRKDQSKTPGKEIGHGGEDIGKGAAKGSVDLGKGVVGGAGNLATGHPIDAGASVGKGAIGFGKNVGVGAGKGTYKIGKGIGGLFKKLGRKSS